MKKISFKLAYSFNLAVYGLIIIYHNLIISGVIPSKYVWGGKIDDPVELIKMEFISLSIVILAAVLTMIRVDILKVPVLKPASRFAMWAIALLFALNTIGNLLAEELLETIIFSPLTLLLSIFSFRIAIDKHN